MGSKKLNYADFLSAVSAEKDGGGYLEGQLLIAMPSMFDPNFERTVIYICAHSDQGAVGLTINRPIHSLSFPELLDQLDIPTINPPRDQMILIGGPVETERGFVLHSVDYFTEDATLRTSEKIGLTATLDILRAIAQGKGPKRKLLAIGYAGWGPGQLEAEIQANGWLHCEADEAIVFDDQYQTKWDRAIAKLGVDPSHLSSDFGHA